MTNEQIKAMIENSIKTRMSDEQVKAIFKKNKRTSEFEVLSIKFEPAEYIEGIGYFRERYLVETTGGKYQFTYEEKQKWSSTRTQYYNRIVRYSK